MLITGSSNNNFMVYNRGNPYDFDRWAEHSGDVRWKYNNVEKYFRKIEDYFGAWDGNGSSPIFFREVDGFLA